MAEIESILADALEQNQLRPDALSNFCAERTLLREAEILASRSASSRRCDNLKMRDNAPPAEFHGHVSELANGRAYVIIPKSPGRMVTSSWRARRWYFEKPVAINSAAVQHEEVLRRFARARVLARLATIPTRQTPGRRHY